MGSAKWTEDRIPSQSGCRVIVTGANSGIGYETARALVGAGAEVVLACRREEAGRGAAERIRALFPQSILSVETLDLASLASVRGFAMRMLDRFDRLDLLINNAGVMIPPLSRTAEGFELQFGVNHLGHFLLSSLLFPLLKHTPAARVVTVASQAHRTGKMDFDDLQWEKRKYRKAAAYGASKLANLLFSFELQRRLDQAGLPVRSVASHPGWTATELMSHVDFLTIAGKLLAMSPAQGALTTLFAAVDESVKGGDYVGPDGVLELRGYPRFTRANAMAHDPGLASKLWQVSQELTGAQWNFD